jgi:hypothetical protein
MIKLIKFMDNVYDFGIGFTKVPPTNKKLPWPKSSQHARKITNYNKSKPKPKFNHTQKVIQTNTILLLFVCIYLYSYVFTIIWFLVLMFVHYVHSYVNNLPYSFQIEGLIFH